MKRNGTAMRLPALLATLALVAASTAGAQRADDDELATLVGAALTDSRAYDKLTWLCDRIGHRLSGSEALDRAVAWAAAEFKRDGIERVWTEPVMVPRWVRGHEAARIVAPRDYELPLLALGRSVGTGAGGLTAEVAVVDGLEQLEALGQEVRGKIVLFDKAMQAGFDADPGYGSVVRLRAHGPSAAARQGAVGMLIRSLGTADYRLPHTGSLVYAEDAPRIPSAAITSEDAALIHRLVDAGETVRVHLELGAHQLDDVASANVLAEILGRELPQEIVLIGAHLDSWDVGQGAHDDGAGCAVVLETMRLLRQHGVRPRRTIRAVLFTNEENGLRGGKDYAARHGTEHHVVAIESDSGGAAPVGFGVTAGPGGVEAIEEIARRLRVIDASTVFSRGGGADIGPLRELGVPVMNLVQDITHYFDYHHTEADTLDKVDPRDLDRNVAAMVLMAYSLAERPDALPRVELTPEGSASAGDR